MRIYLYKDILISPDENKVYLYAILCTMFHRIELYRVKFPCKLICYIIIHDYSPCSKYIFIIAKYFMFVNIIET